MPSFSQEHLNELASLFARNSAIQAVVLSGSVASGMVDDRSDFDLYLYSRGAVSPNFREEILRPRAKHLEIQRVFWEEEDAWIEHDGTQFEAMYRSCDWADNEINARLDRFEASIGYTTAFLFNISRSHILFDRFGWFAKLQNRLKQAYPKELAQAITEKNFPLLGDIIGSYESQIRSAFARKDLVSLNHRVAAWLASYFDILFAANHRFHPGEKRLLVHAAALPTQPDGMSEDLSLACLGATDLQNDVADHLGKMRARLREWLSAKGH